MSKVSKHFPIFILAAVLGAPATRAQSLPPRIFFTDLISGPNTGGENNNGTILTIYGKNFGTTRGTSTVTVGGGAVAAYLQWGAAAPGELGTQKIAVAIGSAAATGNVVVTVGGVASNGVPFTVRSGNIFCVSTTGSDSNPGTFPSSCWRTITFAKNTIAAGDVAYIENGITEDTSDGGGTVLSINSSGSSGLPKALVAYPGASVKINSAQTQSDAIHGGTINSWVFAQLFLESGNQEAIQINDSNDLRFVGNELTCPGGSGSSGCIITDGGNGAFNVEFLGNYIHNVANNCGSNCKLYHAMYPTNGSHAWEIGWNTIVPDPAQTGVAGCYGIHMYASTLDEYDMHVHDNIIHDVKCSGILAYVANTDAASTMGGQGSYEIYNNIIYHVGTGPDPSGNPSTYACMTLGKSSAVRTNPMEIYNNSFYDCGSRLGSDGGMIELNGTNAPLRFRNNIFQAVGSEPYISPAGQSTGCTSLSGSNNDWFGAGAPPCGSTFTSNVISDPKYMDPVTARNFHLQSSSPAIDVGVTISTLLTDLDGVKRPQGPAYDIGAYEFVSGNPPVLPNPPTNLRAVVQ